MAFYSFDTSSILNGRRDLLPPEVFPTVWSRIEAMIDAGSVRAVDVVRDELGRRDDDAYAWAKSHNNLFVPLETPIQARTAEVLAAHPKLMGVGGGRNGADPFVIGLAMTLLGGTVVTEEKPTGNVLRPKIPDVCDAMGVPWMNLVQSSERRVGSSSVTQLVHLESYRDKALIGRRSVDECFRRDLLGYEVRWRVAES